MNNSIQPFSDAQENFDGLYKSYLGFSLPFYPQYAKAHLALPIFVQSKDELQSEKAVIDNAKRMLALMTLGSPYMIHGQDHFAHRALSRVANELGYRLEEVEPSDALMRIRELEREHDQQQAQDELEVYQAVSRFVKALVERLEPRNETKTILVVKGYDFAYYSSSEIKDLGTKISKTRELLDVDSAFAERGDHVNKLQVYCRNEKIDLPKKEEAKKRIPEELHTQMITAFQQASKSIGQEGEEERRTYATRLREHLDVVTQKMQSGDSLTENDIVDCGKLIDTNYDVKSEIERIWERILEEKVKNHLQDLQEQFLMMQDTNLKYKTLVEGAYHDPHDVESPESHLHRDNVRPFVVFVNTEEDFAMQSNTAVPMLETGRDYKEFDTVYSVIREENAGGFITEVEARRTPVLSELYHFLELEYDKLLQERGGEETLQQGKEKVFFEKLLKRSLLLYDTRRFAGVEGTKKLLEITLELLYVSRSKKEYELRSKKLQAMLRSFEKYSNDKDKGLRSYFNKIIRRITNNPQRDLQDTIRDLLMKGASNIDSPLAGLVVGALPQKHKKELMTKMSAEEASIALSRCPEEEFSVRKELHGEFGDVQLEGLSLDHEVLRMKGRVGKREMRRLTQIFENIQKKHKNKKLHISSINKFEDVARAFRDLYSRVFATPEYLQPLYSILFVLSDVSIQQEDVDTLHLKTKIYNFLKELRRDTEPLSTIHQLLEETSALKKSHDNLLPIMTTRALVERVGIINRDKFSESIIPTNIVYRLHEYSQKLIGQYMTSLEREQWDVLSHITFPAYEEYRNQAEDPVHPDAWKYIAGQIDALMMYMYALQGEHQGILGESERVWNTIHTRKGAEIGEMHHVSISTTVSVFVTELLERSQSALVILSLKGDGSLGADTIRNAYMNKYRGVPGMLKYLAYSLEGVNTEKSHSIREVLSKDIGEEGMWEGLCTSLRYLKDVRDEDGNVVVSAREKFEQWYKKLLPTEENETSHHLRQLLRAQAGQETKISYERRKALYNKLLRTSNGQEALDGLMESMV